VSDHTSRSITKPKWSSGRWRGTDRWLEADDDVEVPTIEETDDVGDFGSWRPMT
jgi:hypothetical protein